jgi:hypothetical protein
MATRNAAFDSFSRVVASAPLMASLIAVSIGGVIEATAVACGLC